MRFWLFRQRGSSRRWIPWPITGTGGYCKNSLFPEARNVWTSPKSLPDRYQYERLSLEPPSTVMFWLVACHWRMFKLQGLHIRLLCGYFLRSSNWHSCLLISKLFLRFRGQVFRLFPHCAGKHLQRWITISGCCAWRCDFSRAFDKESLVGVVCSGPCRRSRHGHRSRIS